jgi:hypothetical protein
MDMTSEHGATRCDFPTSWHRGRTLQSLLCLLLAPDRLSLDANATVSGGRLPAVANGPLPAAEAIEEARCTAAGR